MIDQLYSRLRGSLMSTNTPRNDNNIHASTITDLCPREYCLAQEEGIIYTRSDGFHFPPLLMTFQIGHAIHELVTNLLRKANILVKHEVKMTYVYKESVVVTGTIDNIIELPGEDFLPQRYVVEVKSISRDQLKNLSFIGSPTFGDQSYPAVVPHVSHECQVQAYLWLLEKLIEPDSRQNHINTDLGIIIYVPKETYGKYPYYFGEVRRRSSFSSDLEQSLDQIVEYKKSGLLPNRDCSNMRSIRAMNCSRAKLCFSRLEDQLILVEPGGKDVSTEEKQTERKGEPEGNGKDASRKPKRRNTRRGGRVSSDVLDRVQVNSEVCRRILDGTGQEKQQKEGNPYSSDSSNEEASLQ